MPSSASPEVVHGKRPVENAEDWELENLLHHATPKADRRTSFFDKVQTIDLEDASLSPEQQTTAPDFSESKDDGDFSDEESESDGGWRKVIFWLGLSLGLGLKGVKPEKACEGCGKS